MFTKQQRFNILLWCGGLLVLSLVLPAFFHADILTASSIKDNGHFPRETVVVPMHFETDPFGRVTAVTAQGSLLRQSELIDTDEAYLHRIDIEGTFFYASDRGTFSANSDTVAISIYHGLAA